MSKQIETQFRQAAAALQRGDARTAKREFVKLTRRAPQSPGAWYNLGLSCQFLDQHERAVSAYKKALALDPRAVDAWVGLGLSHKHLGDGEAAGSSADKALALDPRHPRALNLLGTLEAEQGNHEAALRRFRQCLDVQPDNTDASINLANLYLDTDDIEAADRVAISLTARIPDDKRLRLIKARVLIGQRAFEQAESLLEKLRSDPPDPDVLRAELALREAVQDYFGVIETAGGLAELAPGDASIRDSLGSAYFQLNSIDRARTEYEKAVELQPHNSGFHNRLGLVYASLGDRKRAEDHYRRALALDPANGGAYLNIAAMKRFDSLSDPDIAAAEELWRHSQEDDARRIELAFALGKMYDDCGAVDEAFSVYKTGNDLKFSAPHIDLDRYFAHLDHIASFFSERPTVTAEPLDGPRPIFVLGMPRSGTTLVEQILSRHPRVEGCGELPCIERAILQMERSARPPRAYPDDFPSIDADELTHQARNYVDWAGRLHALSRPFFTDKMPYNFVHMWVIKALFPGAAIVHCRRHPLDIIVSNYFQLYGSEVSFVYNLAALAEYTVRYYRLMRRWKVLFGDGIIDVSYEALVDDAETGIRRLIDAVGLAWDDACLDPERSAGPVRTTSIWQVRRGVYRESKERWRRYEPHLREAADILVRAGILDEQSLQVVVD